MFKSPARIWSFTPEDTEVKFPYLRPMIETIELFKLPKPQNIYLTVTNPYTCVTMVPMNSQ